MIQAREEWITQLWVDFSHVRDESLFARLEYRLGVMEGKVEFFPGSYAKVIFSGHRGCGSQWNFAASRTALTSRRASLRCSWI
ncbi:MAG: hypothetical protein U0176_20255 [Bacteroidia bacterium]